MTAMTTRLMPPICIMLMPATMVSRGYVDPRPARARPITREKTAATTTSAFLPPV
jgi:hypothetical protein